MPTTPNPIAHDVQRCRHFLERMKGNERNYGPQTNKVIAVDARVVLPHLAAVLAELERLQERDEERRKGEWAYEE